MEKNRMLGEHRGWQWMARLGARQFSGLFQGLLGVGNSNIFGIFTEGFPFDEHIFQMG